MNHLTTRIAFVFLGIFQFFAPMQAQPDTVKIGAFINDIYDINLSEKSFSAQLWVWFNYNNPNIKPLESLEIPNAKSVDYSLDFTEVKKGIQWASKKVHVIMKKDWDIRSFPFDEQKMTIELEEGDADVQSIVYVADIENTKLDSTLILTNWKIERTELLVGTKKYDTNYGDPSLSQGSEYAHATLDIYIKRKSWGLFFSLFTGLYVAFFISSLVFFIDPVEADPRFGLSVGALFAAVGNKYIVDSILPQSTTFTLVDKLHILTYLFLLLCILLSVISLRIWKNGNPLKSARFDRIAYFSLVPAYFLFNIWLIYGTRFN